MSEQRNRALWTIVLPVFATAVPAVCAQPCSPHWSDEFALAGMQWLVVDVCGLDDGSGRALYATGVFRSAGGTPANAIARWNRTSWEPLGSGLGPSSSGFGPGSGLALAAFDHGSGPALIVGGTFTDAGGVSAQSVASWRSGAWTPLGGGLWDQGPNCVDCPVWVNDMVTFNDGTAESLVATGFFFLANSYPGTLVNHIAAWNGHEWRPLGLGLLAASPFFPAGAALGVFNDGGGSRLFVGGVFLEAGGIPVSAFATWDGAEWRDVSGGVNPILTPSSLTVGVAAMTVFDGGSGESLYVGGSFDGVGQPRQGVSGLARWDGTAWHDVGSGVTTASGEPGHVEALAVFDDGNGPALYVAGVFEFAGGVPARNIARWDGSQWSPLGLGLDDGVRALTVYDLGDGEALYIGGDFLTAGGMPSAHIAKWVGCKHTPCPSCVCDFDTTTGRGVCDIIDFVTFAGQFATGDPCACDIDTSTGMGVCDLIDFTTFAGQFAVGCP